MAIRAFARKRIDAIDTGPDIIATCIEEGLAFVDVLVAVSTRITGVAETVVAQVVVDTGSVDAGGTGAFVFG